MFKFRRKKRSGKKIKSKIDRQLQIGGEEPFVTLSHLRKKISQESFFYGKDILNQTGVSNRRPEGRMLIARLD